MKDLFMGVEEEFVIFDKFGNRIPFSSELLKILEIGYEDSFSAPHRDEIWTQSGHCVYRDAKVVEIANPPIAINKGFSSRLRDIVLYGRDKLARATDDYCSLTGHSMHWNVTRGDKFEKEKFLSGLEVMFQLFGLTPLSLGFNIREKSPRVEILGDYIIDDEQVRALALLLGSYTVALEKKREIPEELKPKLFSSSKNIQPNSLSKGRNTHLENLGISAQEYIEKFYSWLEPFIEILGTKDEIENLQDFVSGSNALEYDRTDFYKDIEKQNGKQNGVYLPVIVEQDNGWLRSFILEESEEQLPLPLEGILFGSFISNREMLGINAIRWNFVASKAGQISGSPHDMYLFATRKFKGTSYIAPQTLFNVRT